jgi:hypothetical protein
MGDVDLTVADDAVARILEAREAEALDPHSCVPRTAPLKFTGAL